MQSLTYTWNYPSQPTLDAELRIWTPDGIDPDEPRKWMVHCHGHYSVGPGYSSLSALPMAQKATDAGFIVVASSSKVNYSWFDGSPPNNFHLSDTLTKARAEFPGLNYYLPCIWGFSMGGGRMGMEMADRPSEYSCFGMSAGTVDVINWNSAGNYNADEIGLHNSPLFRIASTNLHGRKMWVKHGTSDGNVNVVYSDNWVAELDPAGLYQYDRTVGVGHVDMFCMDDTAKDGWIAFCSEQSDIFGGDLRAVRTASSVALDIPGSGPFKIERRVVL